MRRDGMRRWVAALAVAAGLVVTLGAQGPEKKESAETAWPPRVVKTMPADRDGAVDPGLEEIKVTFDRAMVTERSWAWMRCEDLGAWPGADGTTPRWEDGGRTCVLAVKLKPDTLYAVGANSFRHGGFRDGSDRRSVPYWWVFRTKKGD
jgi:hypothetical protein